MQTFPTADAARQAAIARTTEVFGTPGGYIIDRVAVGLTGWGYRAFCRYERGNSNARAV